MPYNPDTGEEILRFQPSEISSFFLNNVVIYQEFDDYGNHRIRVEEVGVSAWANYTEISALFNWRGTSNHYTDVLPNVFICLPAAREIKT